MSTEEPTWFAPLRRAHRSKLSFSFSRLGDIPTVTVSSHSGSPLNELSLGAVDDDLVSLDLSQLGNCTLSDSSAGLTLRIKGGSNRRGHRLTLASTVQGRVELEGAGQGLSVGVEEGSPVELAVVAGEVRPCGEKLDHTIELAGGWLDSGAYGHVVVRGEAPWRSGDLRTVAVTNLELLDDAVLDVQASLKCSVDRLFSRQGQRSLRLTAAPTRGDRPGKINVTIKSMESVKLTADDATTLTVHGPLRDSVFAGPAQIVVPQGVALDGPRFERLGKKLPRLRAASQSVITEIGGIVVIQAAAGASLTGCGSGFEIDKVESQSGGQKTDYFTNSYLRNFVVKPGLHGHALLSFMDDAHQVEPSTAALPGWDLRFRRLSSANKVDRRNAEFMRKLSELADTKGASGSVRTKIGWCTQRLRHEATTGWVERRALDGYRCLGYGERPGPPLLTWVALSLIFTLLLWWLGHATVCNVGDFLALWANRAASPVGAILGTGTATEDSAWLYLVRAIVAIPLVVAALCVRKYVRAGK